MQLAIGTKPGPDEIIESLGAGGMREVCEARAVAALNHPHICTPFDIGPSYLVMEYVDGQPLKEQVPLSPEQRKSKLIRFKQ
jgi:serine/threonine protein kinase